MITVRTGTRVARAEDAFPHPRTHGASWRAHIDAPIPTVEVLIGGVIFKTDSSSHAEAIGLALRTASQLARAGHEVSTVELEPRPARPEHTCPPGGCTCREPW